jgi:RNA polymerase sigma-70 factor (ECF subfamily)
MVYCLIPYALAGKLHEPLRRHFAPDPSVEVVVERRAGERRNGPERRRRITTAPTERRHIRNLEGRRIGPRRAPTVSADARALPRRVRPYADQLVFAERLEPGDEHLADLDSARLVTRFQAGDQDAFAALYMRYFDRVYTYLKAIFRDDPHEAEDVTQQVFVRAFEGLPRYERRGHPFRAWLFTIVRNQAMSQLRRRGRSELVEPRLIDEQRESEASEDDMAALSWVTDRELVMFVERLPLSQRQVLILRYMLDLPAKEVARVLDRSHVDVRMLEHRALRFLEARLTAIGRAPVKERRPLPTYGRIAWMQVSRRRRGALHRGAAQVRRAS